MPNPQPNKSGVVKYVQVTGEPDPSGGPGNGWVLRVHADGACDIALYKGGVIDKVRTRARLIAHRVSTGMSEVDAGRIGANVDYGRVDPELLVLTDRQVHGNPIPISAKAAAAIKAAL